MFRESNTRSHKSPTPALYSDVPEEKRIIIIIIREKRSKKRHTHIHTQEKIQMRYKIINKQKEKRNK